MELIGFRSFDWGDAGFFCGLPNGIPFMSAAPQILTRPGTHPTFGPGTITERSIFAQFGINGGGHASLEAAWDYLMQRIAPTDIRPGQLRGRRNDGTIVAINAVLTIPPGAVTGDVDTIGVIFVAVDPRWSALSETTAVKTFNAAADLALHVPISGIIEQEPRVYLKPTVQRAGGTADAGWTWRRIIRVTNNTGRALVNVPYALNLGDTTPLTTTKALANGNDVRIVHQGREVARTLKGWDTGTTLAWITIENLSNGASADYEVWYGNSAATAPATASLALDPANSTNAVWKYAIDDVAANAGKGGWLLSSGTQAPVANTDVPGAWRFATIVNSSPDATWQEKYSDYVDSGAKYRAVFYALRGRATAIPAQTDYTDADGVLLYHPGGITQVRADLKYRNDYARGSSGSPIGRVGIYASDNGESWRTINEWATVQNGSEASIGVANYAVSPGALFVAFATKPFSGSRIVQNASSDRRAIGGWDATLEITVNDAGITQTVIQAEEAIYEIAMDLRTGGDNDLDAPYHVLRIGGASSRRVAARLNENVVVETALRQVDIWDATITTKVASVPVFAVSAREKLSSGGSEVASQKWLPFRAYANPLPNPSFATNVAGWSRAFTGVGVTANAPAHETTTVNDAPGAMRSQITGSTLGAGNVALQERADVFLPIGDESRVFVAADVRTTAATLVPRLALWFYDAAQSPIGAASMEAVWTPAANTWYRRVHSEAVPLNARYYRVGVAAHAVNANQTGSIYTDRVAPGGNELIVRDAAIGTVQVTVGWLPQYL